MKKKLGMLLAVVLCFCMTVVVWADAGKTQSVDYKTDYYMIVESPDGGIDMYSEANTDSPKLNDELIPNGTAIHVEGEHKDDAGKIWFYTQLHGMFGFLQENYLKPATLAEAIASELKLFGSKDVDYDITVNAKEDGSVSLYNGPGKKYGTVSGGTDIKNGEKLHISTEVDTGKDGLWGETTANGVSGWVNIDQATNTEDTPVELVPEEQKTDNSETSLTPVPQNEDVKDNADAADEKSETVKNENMESENTEVQGNEAAEQADTAKVGKGGSDSKEEPKPTSTVTPTPKPTNTEAPKPTNTATPTPKPANTTAPTPEPTNTKAPTPEPTNTKAPTPEPTNTTAPTPEPTDTTAPAEAEVTETPTPEPTNTKAPTPEPTETVAPTEKPAESVTPAEAEINGQETSSENVESSSLVKSPVIWILLIAIVIGIIVVIYLLRKKGKDSDENK